MNRFSPSFIAALIIRPLRYFFSQYQAPDGGVDLQYNDDPKQTKIDISSINNYNKETIQEKPRILVDRGAFSIEGVGLSDNLAEGLPVSQTLGLTDRTNMVLIKGEARIIIEARNEGTCELITDMVSHYLVWTQPFLCDSQGFKEFALPLQVSACSPTKEDTELLQSVITIPYVMEELWTVKNDALKLNNLFTNILKFM